MPEAEHSPLFTDGGSTLGPGDGSALTQNLQPGTSMTVMKRKSNYSLKNLVGCFKEDQKRFLLWKAF